MARKIVLTPLTLSPCHVIIAEDMEEEEEEEENCYRSKLPPNYQPRAIHMLAGKPQLGRH